MIEGGEPNAEQADYWTGERGNAWVREADRFDAQLSVYADRLIQIAAPQAGERVLDVGCGAGIVTLAAAEAVGPTGSVVGLDISPTMLAVARRRAEARALPAEFVCADAQTTSPVMESPDLVVSRFGVMFFADPVAAFANLAAMVPSGARMAFVCWGSIDRNQWMFGPARAVASIIAVPPPAPPDGPGPFAFADESRVEAVLRRAGWLDIAFEDIEDDLHLGGPGTVADAVEFVTTSSAMATPFAQLDPAAQGVARSMLVVEFASRHDGTGVRYPALARCVTAIRSA